MGRVGAAVALAWENIRVKNGAVGTPTSPAPPTPPHPFNTFLPVKFFIRLSSFIIGTSRFLISELPGPSLNRYHCLCLCHSRPPAPCPHCAIAAWIGQGQTSLTFDG